jgi:tol-pal system protein YbgF
VRFFQPAVVAALLVVASATLAYGQKKEIIQMQRDLAILQVEVRDLKTQQGERIAVLEELIKQNLEASNKLNQALGVLERGLAKQGDSVVKPVTSISTQVDSLASQIGALRNAVEALNSRMGKVQQQVQDIQNHLTTLPPPSFGTGSETNAAGTGPAAGVGSAEGLYNAALADYHRGSFETSKMQFDDYLKYYGTTLRAPEAQYYLGDIAYQQRDYASAIRNYDMVLERFPEGSKSPDALYKKGLALMMLNKLPEAAAEFRSVVEKYPNSNIAPNAEAQLAELQGGTAGQKPSPLGRTAP